jgi:hypothetical protein
MDELQSRVRWRVLLRVAVASLLCAVLAGGLAGTSRAGAPPNRLDDNRGNGFTIAGEALIQAAVSALCPIPGFCNVNVGARVESSPNVFNVFWDDNWDVNNPSSPTVSQINNMVSTIVGSSYLDRANQYGVGRGSFIGSHQATACGGRPSGSISFTSLLAYITCEVQVPGTSVPYPDDNTVYALFLPEGTTVSGAIGANCQPGGAAAFHAWSASFIITFLTVLGIPTPIPQLTLEGYPFTVVPASCALSNNGTPIHNVLDATSELWSHELAEASIDPFPPTGWIDDSQFDINNLPQIFSVGEPADICQPGSSSEVPTTPVRMGDGFVVGTYWSNSDNACVPFGSSFHLDENGLPGSVTHTATVNGQPVTLPFNDNFETGSSVSYSFPTPVADPNPGIRYVTGDPGFSGAISGPINDVASYVTQYFLTTGTNPGFLAGSDAGLTPSDWHNSGAVVTLNTTDPIATGPSDRYRFDHWSGAISSPALNPSVTMNAPESVTANYVLQHKVVFNQSGIPGSVTWHVATVDTPNEHTVNDIGPYTTWVDDGGTVSYTYQSPVPGTAGTQYVLTGSSPSSPFVASSATNVLGNYKTQYLLTVATSGLGTNLTHITNSGGLLGTANDTTPLSVWIDSGTPLALGADANVDGAGGVQYFFQNFNPTPPATMGAPFTTNALYETMAQLIQGAINSGGIYGPSAQGLASSLTSKFDTIQSSMGTPKYDAALGQLEAFVNQLQAQTGKEITSSLSTTLQLDAMLVYHNALCKGLALGQINPVPGTNDYTFYSGLVASLGGTVLPPC